MPKKDLVSADLVFYFVLVNYNQLTVEQLETNVPLSL